MRKKILFTDDGKATWLIRLMVGTVFLSEGLQKFIFSEKLGSGRFAKIGLPSPAFLAPFVGTIEILCSILVLVGLFTRLAVVPLFFIIVVAILSTKLQLFASGGFWAMLHESRTDWAMLLGIIFLFLRGGGWWSMDKRLTGP